MDLMKVEVLLTRQCNLRCGGCRLAQNNYDEMSLEEWKKAIDIIFNDLGASFAPMYGREPLAMARDKLLGIIEHVASYRNKGKDFTIISNSTLLHEKLVEDLINAGMDSYTGSIDTLSSKNIHNMDAHMKKKSQAGLRWLVKLKEKYNLRDVCGIITVTKNNINKVYETIKFLSEKGIWSGVDFLHYDKSGNSQKCLDLQNMKTLKIEREDMNKVRKESDKILDNYDDLLLFPSKDIVKMWKNPRYVVDLDWKCSKPICICLDCDGSVRECDEFQGSRIRKYTIFDLKDKDIFEQFQQDYIRDVREECPGCFWSTHVLAEEAYRREKGRDYYAHRDDDLESD